MAEEKAGTVTEPKAAPKVEPKIDIDGILAELEKAQVKTVEDVQGKFKASREAGQLANILGEVRRENAELKDLIKAQKAAPKDEFDYTGQQPVDLEDSIMRAVMKVETAKEKRNQEANERNLRTWNVITGDDDYSLVKPVWEEKLKDPNFVFRMQSGQVDPLAEYNKTVRDFLKGMATQAGDAIKSLRGPGIKPPHTESGTHVPEMRPDQSSGSEYMKTLREKAARGKNPTEDEELKALDVMLKGIL